MERNGNGRRNQERMITAWRGGRSLKELGDAAELRVERAALKGRRVRLISCSDGHTKLRPGALGTVSSVDDAGTIHVDWDCGSKLGLVADAGDRYQLLPKT